MVRSWCCECKERNDRPPARLVDPKERGCTDVFFLFLFFLSWLGIVIIFVLANQEGGNPERITNGVNFRGKICGIDSGVENLPHAAWPDPQVLYFRVCVADCADTENPVGFLVNHTSSEFAGYCIPKLSNVINGSISVELTGDFESISESTSRAIGDILTAWVVIAASVVVALVFSYVWTWLTRYIAGFMVWTTILLIILAGFLVGYYFLQQANEYEETEVSNRAKALRYTGIAFIVGTLVFLCIVFALRQRIRIAIAVIKEASSALMDMKSIVCFPVIPLLVGVGYIVFWIAIALWIFSVGTNVPKDIPEDLRLAGQTSNADYNPDTWLQQANSTELTEYFEFEWDETFKRAFAYHFFHLLYVTAFIIYFTYTVSAGAVAEWYFTPYVSKGHKPRGIGPDKLSRTPIRDSLCRTTKFHLGSISIGALIIATVRFIRAVVTYLEAKTIAAEGEPNRCQKALHCCLHCCLWWVECCLDKINKNAFIWMSIWGDPFGTSACSAFALIWRNLARVAAISLVGNYLMMLGKVVVALSSMGVAAMVMSTNQYYKDNLSSIVMPSIVCFIVAYLVAAVFMTTYETTIDTTFFCFLVDEEHNKPNLVASPELARLVDQFSVQSRTETKRQLSFKTKGRYPGGKAPAGFDENGAELAQTSNRGGSVQNRNAEEP